jgi:hypothetical protein
MEMNPFFDAAQSKFLTQPDAGFDTCSQQKASLVPEQVLIDFLPVYLICSQAFSRRLTVLVEHGL